MSAAETRRTRPSALALAALVLLLCLPGLAAGVELLVDGDFEAMRSGKDLRIDNKGQDWYESRRDTKEGTAQLKLSTRFVGGNRTRKAMIKAHPELNTYLTQRFAEPQTGRLLVSYDIYVAEILPDDDRSAFCLVGASRDKENGPNSTGRERFVFLGFTSGETDGKLDLFARECGASWDEKTIAVRNLDRGRWYTVVLDVNVTTGTYKVKIDGVTDWFELEAFCHRGRMPKKLTHVSFASWNDGAGTFYVDNVSVRTP
jgi:hypothetical protein